MQAHPDTHPGQAVYGDRVLQIYDTFVLGLAGRWIWRCPSHYILELYDRNTGPCHLDAGVGSGYFLDRCRFPCPNPRITLLDLNTHSLAYTERRIKRYRPETVRADVLETIPLKTESFDSIGMSYLVHCLPGDMAAKTSAFMHLAPLLRNEGVLFGATILAQGVPHHFLSRKLMGIYNQKGIFGNAGDSEAGLRKALEQAFSRIQIRLVECVALFEAREPRRDITESKREK